MGTSPRESEDGQRFGGLSAVEAHERVVEAGESPEAVAADAGIDPATVHRAVAAGYDLAGGESGGGSVAGSDEADDAAGCPCDLMDVIDAPCDAVIDAVADGIVVLGSDGTIEYANRTAEHELRGGPGPLGANVLAALREGLDVDPGGVDEFARRFRAVATGDTEEERFEITSNDGAYHYDVRMTGLEGAAPRQVVVAGRGVTEPRERERELRQRRDELARLERISIAIESVLAAVSEASSVEEVEQALCERLIDTELYDLAYVARWSATTGVEEVTAAADAPPGLEDDIAGNDDGDGYHPVEAAFETGECQFIEDVEEEPVDESVAETSSRYGHRSGVVVPLGGPNGDRFLGIAATRPRGFSERERVAFDTLRDVVSLAITAVRHRSLLVADATREYEFRVPGERTWASKLPESCTWHVQGVVPAGDQFVHYLHYEGAPGSAVRESLEGMDPVTDVRLDGDGDAGRVSFRLPASVATSGRLADVGGRVRRMDYDGEVIRIVCEVPPDVRPSQVVETIGSIYPAADMAAQRVHEGGLEAADQGPDLTERQRAALRAATLEGYYEWPREATATEVADVLDIATPTLLRHLRLAHGRLARRALDDDSI